jgi:hypothetical protein
MSQIPGGEPESLLPHALQRAERLEVAASFVAKVVALELADITLDGSINTQTQEELAAVAQKLMDVAGLCNELVVDIAGAAGLEIESETHDAAPAVPATSALPLIPPATPAHTNGHNAESVAPPDPEPIQAPTSSDQVPSMVDETAVEIVGGDSNAETEAPALSESTDRLAEPKREESEELTSEVLYSRIINPDLTPKMRPKTEQFPIMVSGNRELKVKGNTIQLGKHELFLFNALLILREEPRSAQELKELGFYPDAATGNAINQAFYQGMTKLIEKVNQAAGREIFKKIGERLGAQYVVNPDLVLLDMRDEEEEPVTAGQFVKKK